MASRQYMTSLLGPEPSVGDINSSISATAQLSFHPEKLVMTPEVSQAYLVVRCDFGFLHEPEPDGDWVMRKISEAKVVKENQRMILLVTPRKVPAPVRFIAAVVGAAL